MGPYMNPAPARLGPMGEGHKGDMPVLTVDANGKATQAVTAPHLTVAAVKGHAIMIHAGGDNYSDQPAPLGGGGSFLGTALYPSRAAIDRSELAHCSRLAIWRVLSWRSA